LCSRRTLLATTAGAACTLALAACGGDGDSNAGAGDDGASGASDSPSPSNGETGGGDGGGDDGEAVAALDEVPIGEAMAFTTPEGDNALLFRSDATTVAAFSAVCTHQGGALQPDGEQLRCSLHNSVFDAATGEVLDGPADENLPAVAVRIEDDQVVTG
jgi:nitrite reductase/ring-hydroxylating ferredoxin subunit